MEVTPKIRARILDTLLLIFSDAFVLIPLVIEGHPGETVPSPQRTMHLI
jgi:hypothetical protein